MYLLLGGPALVRLNLGDIPVAHVSTFSVKNPRIGSPRFSELASIIPPLPDSVANLRASMPPFLRRVHLLQWIPVQSARSLHASHRSWCSDYAVFYQFAVEPPELRLFNIAVATQTLTICRSFNAAALSPPRVPRDTLRPPTTAQEGPTTHTVSVESPRRCQRSGARGTFCVVMCQLICC